MQEKPLFVDAQLATLCASVVSCTRRTFLRFSHPTFAVEQADARYFLLAANAAATIIAEATIADSRRRRSFARDCIIIESLYVKVQFWRHFLPYARRRQQQTAAAVEPRARALAVVLMRAPSLRKLRTQASHI